MYDATINTHREKGQNIGSVFSVELYSVFTVNFTHEHHIGPSRCPYLVRNFLKRGCFGKLELAGRLYSM